MKLTYRITFKYKTHCALALFELHAWNIPDSKYKLNTNTLEFYYCNKEVVDVVTETFSKNDYTIEKG